MTGCILTQVNISSIAVLGASSSIHMRSTSRRSYPKELTSEAERNQCLHKINVEATIIISVIEDSNEK